MNVDGIGKVKQFPDAVYRWSCRNGKIRTPWELPLVIQKVLPDYYMERKYLCKEQVYVLMFDSNHHLLKRVSTVRERVDHAVVSPRDIFIDALKYQAKQS